MPPPNDLQRVQQLISQGNASAAQQTAQAWLDALGSVTQWKNMRERALAFNQAWYALALAREAAGQLEAASAAVSEAHQYDSLVFQQQADLVRIAIAARNWPLAERIADHFVSHLERHGLNRIGEEIIAMIEPVEQQYAPFTMLINGYEERYKERYGEGPEGDARMVADYERLGIDANEILLVKASNASEYGDDDLALKLWQQVDWRAYPRARSFAQYAMLCLREGLPVPDVSQLSSLRDPEWLYNAGTDVVTPLSEDSWYKNLSNSRARPYWQLAADLLQRGYDHYIAFEDQGERNGFATDPHFFAMLCNNYGIALGKLDRENEAWPIHERGFHSSPFIENALNAAYGALQSGDAAAAQRCAAQLQTFVEECFGEDDIEYGCRAQSYVLAAAGLSESPDEWLPKREAFQTKWANNRKHARFCNSDEHHFPEDWRVLFSNNVGALNDQWEAMKRMLERHPDDARLLHLMLRNRRDHGGRSARESGLALADKARQLLEPQRHTAEGAARWFEARYSLAYLRYRSWFYDADLVGQDWLPQARKEFAECIVDRAADKVQGVDAMLDYGMLLVREDIDVNEGIRWLSEVIQTLEPQPRAPADEDDWRPDTAPDPALALAYVYRAHALCMQDQNDRAIPDLDAAAALNPWFPAVWYWRATIESEAGNADAAIQWATRFVEFDGINPPDDEERATMLSALVQLLHATGQTEQARERLDELEQLDDSHDDLPELHALFEPAGKKGKSLWSKVKGWLG